MMAQEFLRDRRDYLLSIIGESDGAQLQSAGFAVRVAGAYLADEHLRIHRAHRDLALGQCVYGGFPAVTYLGYLIAAGELDAVSAGGTFLSGLNRIQQRPDAGLAILRVDDVALLGITDGLMSLPGVTEGLDDARAWISSMLAQPAPPEQWTSRLRALAADLIDGRGRLRTPPNPGSMDALALDLALRPVWSSSFLGTPIPSAAQRDAVLRCLLTSPPPSVGDLERGVVWQRAIDVLLDAMCDALSSSVSDVSRLLLRIEHGFKRWPWKDRSRRQGTMPSRWLIDDEYDVQSLLWTVLYPVYEADLVEETYLPGWGQVQPRADLGILKLKLIIEVKFARRPGDFADIEEQVAGDLGIYVKETHQFDHMVVVVYDDSDAPQPERYDGLRNALMKRERIEDVVILRRPSMIPGRSLRAYGDSPEGSQDLSRMVGKTGSRPASGATTRDQAE